MKSRSLQALRAALLSLPILLAACGGSSPAQAPSAAPQAPAATAAAQPAAATPPASQPAPASLQPVTLQLTWIISGYHAPFVLALEKGYYRQAGLDVKIVEGRGSSLTVDQVAKGGMVFGQGGIEGFVPFIDKGAPIKVIAAYVRESPMSFIYHPSLKLDTPKDLVGKTIISAAGDQDLTFLPAVLKPYGVSQDQLKVQLTTPNQYPAIYAQSANNVVIGFVNGDYTRVLQVDPQAKDKLYSDFGLNLYNAGLVASESLIQQHPDVVKAFVEASNKGWQEAIANPAEAVDATVKDFPQANRAVIDAGLKYSLPLLDTPATKGRPLGWMAPADWEQQLQVYKQFGQVKSDKPATDYYTDQFVGG